MFRRIIALVALAGLTVLSWGQDSSVYTDIPEGRDAVNGNVLHGGHKEYAATEKSLGGRPSFLGLDIPSGRSEAA